MMRQEITGNRGVREDNLLKALANIRLHGALSNAELARLFGVPATTTARYISQLKKLGFIEAFLSSDKKKVGKPPVLNRINASAFGIVCIQITKSHVYLAYSDFCGCIYNWSIHDINDIQPDSAAVLKRLMDSMLLTQPNMQLPPPALVSVAVSSIVQNGTIHNDTVKLGCSVLEDALEQEFQLPAIIENDANAAVLAEKYFGGYSKPVNMACLLDSIDLGIGFIINNLLYKGAYGLAGETTVKSLEQLVKPARLIIGDARDISRRDFFVLLERQYASGNSETRQIIENIMEQLALEAVRIVRLIDPEVLIIAGDCALKDSALEMVFNNKYEYVSRSMKSKRQTQVVFSKLEDKAVLKGAAFLGIEELTRHALEKWRDR